MSTKRNREPRTTGVGRSTPRDSGDVNVRAQQPAPRPTAPIPSDEATDKPAEVESFTAPDPTAWAWLNVWPFMDDTVATGAADREPPAALVDPDPVTERSTTVDEKTPSPVPPGAASRTLSQAPVAGAAPRSQQGAGIAAVVAAALVAAVALLWVATGQGSEEVVVRARSDPHPAPVHLPPGTSFVRSRMLPSGQLEVTHWIHSRVAVASLTVHTPRTLGLTRGSVSASHFSLAADGTPYPAAWVDEGHSSTHTFRFPTASEVFLRYRLAGTVRLGGPDGRALARITSLAVTTDSAMTRTTLTVTGVRVLALACSAPTATALPQPCGQESDGSWHVTLDRIGSRERVMAQLDLSCDAPADSSARCAALRSQAGHSNARTASARSPGA
jgi:hypothetical protein